MSAEDMISPLDIFKGDTSLSKIGYMLEEHRKLMPLPPTAHVEQIGWPPNRYTDCLPTVTGVLGQA